MFRRIAALAALATAAAAVATLGTSTLAGAAVSVTHITSPTDGTHYLVTDAIPATTVTVSGTSNGISGDTVDVRCYYNSKNWTTVQDSVAVAAGGSFSLSMSTDVPYGTCVLRAVPHGLAPGSSTVSYTGPRITSEEINSQKVSSGINTGKVYDYYIRFQGSQAMNDYVSATSGGLWDSRLQYADGTSSNLLWYSNAGFYSNNTETRSFLQVDGHNGYGPDSARNAYSGGGAAALPGLPQLTFSVSRNSSTGTTTIHETDPIVRCNDDTYPATSLSCTSFLSTGVRLERTLVTDDGGRQVHITDVWRSTDGHAHTVSAHYDQWVQGQDSVATGSVSVPVGLKLPWVSSAYQTFSGDTLYNGTSTIPSTIFVRDSNTAPDGSTAFPRGAITFDTAVTKVHRAFNGNFTLRSDGISVPAGGTRTIREDFAMGTTEAQVASMAAVSRIRINPRRPDGMIKVGSSAYVGNGVYNTTGLGQTVTAKKKRGRKAVFSVDVQNDGTFTDSYTIRGNGNRKGFSVAYFAGTKDITSQVIHGTYTMQNLVPGQQRVIRLVVTVKATAKKGILRSWLVTATSTHDTTSRDTVKANVKVPQG